MPPTTSSVPRTARPGPALRRLAAQVVEVADLDALARLLTRGLPPVLGIGDATLLLWDRKLDTFEAYRQREGRTTDVQPGKAVAAPDTRFLLADGVLIETSPTGAAGVLVPLTARSGLVGMLVLGAPAGRRRRPFRSAEVRLLSDLAARAALALENHLYQRELISSERMAALGTMAGMLAHDFRGPMTVIRGYAETLLEEGVDPVLVRQRAQLIVQMVDRLERMTGETLDFARGGGRLVRRTLPARMLLAELAATVRQEVVGLEVEEDARLGNEVVVAVDVDKLRRVVGNLAANARDAMGGRGRLHLAATLVTALTSLLELTVADDGPGVPESLRERLFDPFVTHGKKSGTGLGLAVARRFVEDHGGTIELLPADEVRRGACFRIRLPLAAPGTPAA